MTRLMACAAMPAVAGWVAAFILAQVFAGNLAQHLPLESGGEPVRYAVAFVLIFVAGAFVGGFVATLVRRLAKAVGLRPVDRTLGAVFGVLRGAALLWRGQGGDEVGKALQRLFSIVPLALLGVGGGQGEPL